MGDTNQGKGNENGEAINLLERFGVVENNGETDQSEKPKLDLNLSLGGLFNGEECLAVSSSITIGKFSAGPPGPKIEMDRSTYAPVNAESEPSMMLLKEMQTLRRIKAKKRLIEQKKARAASAAIANGDEKSLAFAAPPPPPQPLVSAPPSGSESEALSSGSITVGGQGSQPVGAMATQVEGRSSEMGNPLKRSRIYSMEMEEEGMNQLKQMPSVCTIGEGPNGKNVEGFLNTCKKPEVCILCVCHGIDLSPEEFVKHAGGNQVANPMKHIRVFPTFY